jgi:hypothetical protein
METHPNVALFDVRMGFHETVYSDAFSFFDFSSTPLASFSL